MGASFRCALGESLREVLFSGPRKTRVGDGCPVRELPASSPFPDRSPDPDQRQPRPHRWQPGAKVTSAGYQSLLLQGVLGAGRKQCGHPPWQCQPFETRDLDSCPGPTGSVTFDNLLTCAKLRPHRNLEVMRPPPFIHLLVCPALQEGTCLWARRRPVTGQREETSASQPTCPGHSTRGLCQPPQPHLPGWSGYFRLV